MAYYPTVPSTPSRSSPSSPSTNAAFLTSLLPALTGLIPGPQGAALGALASIPGQLLNYDATRQATEEENRNRQLAIDMIGDWTPYVSRPKEFNIDTRVPYVAQAVRVARNLSEKSTQAQDQARARMGASGDIPEEQMLSALGEISRGYDTQRGDSVNQLMEDAQREYVNNQMAIGNAELSRESTNQQMGGTRVQMLAEALTSPYGVASTAGMLQNIQSQIQNAQQLAQQERDRQTQERISKRNMWGSLGGSAIGAAGTLGAGAFGYAGDVAQAAAMGSGGGSYYSRMTPFF